MKIKRNVGIHNQFRVEVRDANTDELKQEAFAYNIILDNCFNRMCAWQYWWTGIAFGTGTGTLASSRTTLFNYLGWKRAQTYDLPDHGPTIENRALPLSHLQRRITIYPAEYVGETFTEVGCAYGTIATGTNYSGLVTHAMLEDAEGNPITLGPKTDTDVIQIYADVFFELGEMWNDQVRWVEPVSQNRLLDYLFYTGTSGTASMTTQAFRAGTSRWFGYANEGPLGNTPTVTAANWIPNSPSTATPTRRFDISDANGLIRTIGFGDSDSRGIFRMILPVDTVRAEFTIEDLYLGVGDGVEDEFTARYQHDTDVWWDLLEIESINPKIDDITVDPANYTTNLTLGPVLPIKKTIASGLDNTGYGVSFSPDGNFMAAAHVGGDRITVYEFDPVAGTVGDKLTIDSGVDNASRGVSFSPDGNFMAVAHSDGEFITVYEFDPVAGTVGDKLTIASGVNGVGNGVSFSPDGNFIAVAHLWGQRITVYPGIWTGESWGHVRFNTPPAIDEVVTADVVVKGLPKSRSYVLDVSAEITFTDGNA